MLGNAAGVNNVDAIEFLLAREVDRGYLDSALREAILHNGVAAARMLLAHGARLGDMYGGKGLQRSTYHFVATRNHRAEMIALLQAQGVDFRQAPDRAVTVGVGTTKLSPLDYAKEVLSRWPGEAHLHPNIAAMEGR